MTACIYFYKHGFQTDGVSLWIVQIGRQRFFTKEIVVLTVMESKFQSRNPHAFFLGHLGAYGVRFTRSNGMCLTLRDKVTSGKNHIYNKIVIA